MGRKKDTSLTKVIVNLATADKWYRAGQERLKQSLKVHDTDAHHIFFQEEREVGAPPHRQNPYLFKPMALNMMRGEGADLVMWLDASMYAVSSLAPLWERLERSTHIFQANGDWTLLRWCNQSCIDLCGITDDELYDTFLYSAGFTCLNLTTDKGNEFLDAWLHYGQRGAFIGSWKDHRHDMSVASWLATKLKMTYDPDYTIFCYIGKAYQQANGPPPKNAVFYLKPV